MSLSLLATICGFVTLGVLGTMAASFWRNPVQGLALTTHRAEMLPQVMADRYAAFAMLAIAVLLLGDLRFLAVLFALCAFMGFADGWIYARAGHPHLKHTFSGVLSVVALGVTLAALIAG
jgi:hypothetical protein